MMVQTVLNDVSAENLGVTLTHEHFSLNFDKFYCAPPNELKRFFGPVISLKNIGYVRQYPYASATNVEFYGKEVEDAVLNEMRLFLEFGGGTIVENTTYGIDRNLDFLYTVAKNTGVNVIAGTGHYVEATQTPSILSKTVEELCEQIRFDLNEGHKISASLEPIKCGVIGEVGSSWPITDFEKRAIEAAAIVQQEVGCAVSFHPGRDSSAPFEIMRLYAEAGGDMSKANMSHLDRTLQQTDKLLEFASLGSFCQFDLFGTEVSHYMLAQLDMPSDAQRINCLKILIDDGHGDRLLVSHDIHTKHRLVDFGGHGYSHLLTNVRPQMLNKGIDKMNVDMMFIHNPASWLCY